MWGKIFDRREQPDVLPHASGKLPKFLRRVHVNTYYKVRTQVLNFEFKPISNSLISSYSLGVTAYFLTISTNYSCLSVSEGRRSVTGSDRRYSVIALGSPSSTERQGAEPGPHRPMVPLKGLQVGRNFHVPCARCFVSTIQAASNSRYSRSLADPSRMRSISDIFTTTAQWDD